MKKAYLLYHLLIAQVLFAFNGLAQASRNAFESAVAEAVKEGYSGTILAADHGDILYHEAFGYRDHEKKIRMVKTDIFEMASVSKQFTAMIILMLYDKGLLRFDDPIARYVTVPYPGISIRHLLQHTSGLPDYQALMDQHWDKTKIASNKEIIAYLNEYAPSRLFEPGTKYEYSNTGYVLLASIAEKVSGGDFIGLCRDRIFRELNMASTDIRSLEQKAATPNFALGHVLSSDSSAYVRADRFRLSDYTYWLGNRKGPGRISSNAEDLLRWDQALYTGTLVKESTLLQAFEPGKLNDGTPIDYGFGWMLGNEEGTASKVVYHTGDNPGYQTKIVRLLTKKRTLILLCNNDYKGFHPLSKTLENILNQ